MTEREFWTFISGAGTKERVAQLSSYKETGAKAVDDAGRYIGSHACLYDGYDKLPIDKIAQMGELMLCPGVSIRAKIVIMMTLAHHPSQEALSALKKYNEVPDEELRYMVPLAIEECEFWNE